MGLPSLTIDGAIYCPVVANISKGMVPFGLNCKTITPGSYSEGRDSPESLNFGYSCNKREYRLMFWSLYLRLILYWN